MQIEEMTLGIRRGDEEAFNAFYVAYSDRMYRYLLVVCGGREELARDALQDALLRVVRYLKPLSDDEALWRSLTVYMRSSVMDQYRRRKASRVEVQVPWEEWMEPTTPPPSEDGVSDRLLKVLGCVLEGLPSQDRQLIKAHYYGGQTQICLAESQGCAPTTLAMRLHRIRRRLREAILEKLAHE